MKTVVVTLTDQNYFYKVKRTILDIRSRGEWNGDLVLITVGFDAPSTFLDYYKITPFRVEHINTNELVEKYKKCPIRPTCDNREFAKLTQWDKFYVFDTFFFQWDKVIYLDAGLRVLDRIQYLADLPCENAIIAPDDSPSYDGNKRFGGIIETDRNPEVVDALWKEYDPSILLSRYFLNCIWMYDTSLLKTVCFNDFVHAMNKYPICRCNEMTIMNLLLTFKHKVWKPFPEFIQFVQRDPIGLTFKHSVARPIPEYVETVVQKRLFGWTEHDRDYGNTTWRDFCFLKYPTTINFECE
jgi:hypothetical protein